MVTPEEIGRIKVFADLAPGDRERLCRVAADISLGAGQFAVHEGDERALFGLLEGRIEVVKLVDGDRACGRRPAARRYLRRDLDHARHATSRSGFRAAEASRVFRIEPPDYHAVAAVAPEVARRVGLLASDRLSGPRGLQGLVCRVAAAPRDRARPPLGRRLRRAAALPRPQPDPVQVAAARRAGRRRAVGGSAAGRRRLPGDARRRRQDRRATAAPARRRAARHRDRARGRGVRHRRRRRRPRRALRPPSTAPRKVSARSSIEREAPGGQAGTSSRIENYLGFPSGVSGDELASRALQQARRLGAEILVTRSITRSTPATRQVHLDGGDVLRARTIILACGVSWRRLVDRGLRPARRQGHLLRRGAQRGGEHARPRRPHRRRRELGGAGGAVLLDPRAHA